MKNWYIVRTLSGKEGKVKESLEKNIEQKKMEHLFGHILIPTEDVLEIKAGKRSTSKRKIFPGYILIEMIMTDKTWHLVKNTSLVFGFIGGEIGKPKHISHKEATTILEKIEESSYKPKPKTLFKHGEMIKVIDGPFIDFNGTVEEINYDKHRLCISVLIFGRSTPIELDFSQVEKL